MDFALFLNEITYLSIDKFLNYNPNNLSVEKLENYLKQFECLNHKDFQNYLHFIVNLLYIIDYKIDFLDKENKNQFLTETIKQNMQMISILYDWLKKNNNLLNKPCNYDKLKNKYDFTDLV